MDIQNVLCISMECFELDFILFFDAMDPKIL